MNAKFVKKRKPAKLPHGHSPPQLSPLYTQPPFEYRDAWSMTVLFRSDPEAIAHLIPKPLVADPEATMFVNISRFFSSGFGRYNEMLLGAITKYRGRTVNYCLYHVLDNDIAIAAGREIWGFPKTFGRVGLVERDGVLVGEVERGGLMICRAAMEIGPLVPPAELAGSAEYATLKLVPSVCGGAAPDLAQLTSVSLTGLEVKQVFKGRATLSFGDSPADRLNLIPVREVVGGYYYNADFSLGHGEVLHDYRGDWAERAGGRGAQSTGRRRA